MTEQDGPRFLAAMVALYKAFGKKEDADISKILFLSIKHLTIDDAEQCITQAILTCEEFPTPVKLKRCISLIPRREVPRVGYEPIADKKLAAESMHLINGILDGKLNHDQTIACMSEMDRRHPGIGWRKQAAKLVQHYRENNACPA